jgi:hypothetical protein
MTQKTCLIDGCDREAKQRGLCVPCYHAAQRLVRLGMTTWEELESLRLAAPRVRCGRRSKVLDAIELRRKAIEP